MRNSLTMFTRGLIAACVATALINLPVTAPAAHPQGDADTAQIEAANEVASARVAAGKDRHYAAINHYLRAMELKPALRADLGKELAFQYTWSEQPDSAISWYDRHLEAHPDDVEAQLGKALALSWAGRIDEAREHYRRIAEDDDNVEARVGLARVTSWTDRLDEARAMYEEILEDAPDNRDARLGHAQVVNWSGRHREAAGLYRALLKEDPDDGEAREGLARAQMWMGRNDLAAGTLAAGDVERNPVKQALADVRAERDPHVSYTYARNEDSDDVTRHSHTFRGSLAPGYLSRLEGYLSIGDIERPTWPSIDRTVAGLSWNRRFNTSVATAITAGYEWNGFDRFGPESFWLDEFNLFVFDAYATLSPADWVRADVGIARDALDTPVPVFRGIAYTSYSAGLDYRFRTTMTSVSSMSWSDYTDGNARFAITEKLVWRPVYRLPIDLRHRFTSHTGVGYLSFREVKGNGYYNPDHYLSLFELLEVDINIADDVSMNLNTRLALEREDSGDWFTAGSMGGSVTWGVWGGLSLTAGYYASRSRLDTQSGYESDGFYVTTGYAFRK